MIVSFVVYAAQYRVHSQKKPIPVNNSFPKGFIYKMPKNTLPPLYLDL
jgi:hypothetical protein